MYDTVTVLDEPDALSCPNGHPLRSFQTKDLDEPSMQTYLVRGGRLYLTVPVERRASGDDGEENWRIEGDLAVREHRHTLREVSPPRAVRVYSQCRRCPPILVRTDRTTFFGDLVEEHALFVDFVLTFRRGAPTQVERTSGTLDDLKKELAARGVYVLDENEPLAIAHREVRKARETLDRHGARRRWGD